MPSQCPTSSYLQVPHPIRGRIGEELLSLWPRPLSTKRRSQCRQGTSKPNPQPPRFSGPQPHHPPRPCAMCSRVLKLTIIPSPAPVVLASWAYPKSSNWSPITASVLHVPRLTASVTSARLPTTKCVPRVASKKESPYIRRLACTTTRPPSSLCPRSAPTGQFPS